jgi:hypothetical protein
LVQSAVITPGLGQVGSGASSRVVKPTTTTTYTLTATGCGGTATQQVTVVVNPPTPTLPLLQIIQADLAVTDLFADKLPQGKVFVRITNNGPDSLTNASATLTCTEGRTPVGGGPGSASTASGPITINLNPGQTVTLDTGISVNTSQFKYNIKCTISFMLDPKDSNNSYSENVPP